MSTFFDALCNHYERHPEKTAIWLQIARRADTPITYRRLLENAHAYAQAYAARGIQPGEVVILILQHGEALLAAFWGAVLHGAIPSILPFLTEKLSPQRYKKDLTALIGVTRPAAIVTYPEFAPVVQEALTPNDSVRAVLLPAETPPPSPPDFSRLAGRLRQPEDIVLLQHSSGTTGLQKGVALSHRAVFNQLQAYSEAIRLDRARDVIVSWLPLYHDMGLIASFLLPVLEGVPLVLMSPFDWVRAPYRLLQAVSHYRGTLTWMPNFAYMFCAQKIRDRHLEGVDLSSWRAVINCSEPVRPESHQVFYERFQPYGLRYTALQTSYAMAENTFAVTQSDLSRPPVLDAIQRTAFLTQHRAIPAEDESDRLVMMSSGRPIANTRVRIVDDQGRDVPPRTVGEIAIRSNCMLTGYYNRPDLTEKAFLDGWYLTGDYGYMVDGELFVCGRKKEIIIVGGKNIYPQDIESLVYEVPGTHPGRAVAFGIDDPHTGTEEVVVVAESDNPDPTFRQNLALAIQQHVSKNAPITLRRVLIVDRQWIIKTSSGKPARTANKAKYLAHQG